MATKRILEQHIAVFGESGSGKTVLLSSFYGAAQEPANIRAKGFSVVAENSTQGTRLHQNFLGMKKSARTPAQTRLSASAYSFLIKLKHANGSVAKQNSTNNELRLVWHDYPGGWFEQDVSGAEEAQRRITTFRALLSSDVALLLVDGQLLRENAGSEASYLKSVLSNYRNQLSLLKEQLLPANNRFVKFPRIWILALSKSDLLPEMDVNDFKELLVEKAGEDLIELRDEIAQMIEGSDALSIGEDFAILSSAEFGNNEIEVSKRVGVDLILPLAAILPLERHLEWVQNMKIPRTVAMELMDVVEQLAITVADFGLVISRLLDSKSKLLGAVGLLISRFGPRAVKAVRELLSKVHTGQLAKEDLLTTALIGFKRDLDAGEKDLILVTRP